MSNYVPPRVASKQLGVSTKTLERWEKEGKIKAYRTPAGHRRYDINSVISTGSSKPAVLYARVSSHSQKSDLEKQVQFLLSRYPGCEVVSEVGSGLNFKRKKLLSLLERAIAGDIGMVIVASKDRLARFGFDLIAWFCQKFGCKVLVLNATNLSPEREMLEDILAIIHVFSCRLYGLRKYKKQIAQDPDLPLIGNKAINDER